MTTSAKISYKSAIKEIEKILHAIEDQDLDIDELTGQLKRAFELIRICKKKLTSTETEVEKILKEMED